MVAQPCAEAGAMPRSVVPWPSGRRRGCAGRSSARTPPRVGVSRSSRFSSRSIDRARLLRTPSAMLPAPDARRACAGGWTCEAPIMRPASVTASAIPAGANAGRTACHQPSQAGRRSSSAARTLESKAADTSGTGTSRSPWLRISSTSTSDSLNTSCLLEYGIQQAAKLRPRRVQSPPHAADRDAHHGRDLRIVQALQLAKYQRGADGRRNAVEQRLNQYAAFRSRDLGPGAARQVRDSVDRYLGVPSRAPANVQTHPDDDLVKPGIEAARSPVGPDRSEGANEGLLRRVLGVARPAKDEGGETDDAGAVARQQPVDRGVVAGLRPRNPAGLLAVLHDPCVGYRREGLRLLHRHSASPFAHCDAARPAVG